MKVGDLVKQLSWDGAGVITEVETDERHGHVWVFWSDGECGWINKKSLRVINESR
tara:strand:- start:1121 stop:1285 length:165 start_codon:yes stop_codon:yes gene_type:complete